MSEFSYTDMANRAADSLEKTARVNDERRYQEEQRNAPLSGYEKWLGKLMSGELSPKQAAIAAKLEAQGHPAFAQPQQTPLPAPGYDQGPASYGYQPGNYGPPSPVVSQGLAAPEGPQKPRYPMLDNRTDFALAAKAGDTSQQTERMVADTGWNSDVGLSAPSPQTRGDFNSMVGVAPLIRSKRDMSPQQIELELLKERGRNSRNAYSNDTRTDIATQERERKTQEFAATAQFKQQQLQQQWAIAMAKLSAYQRVASMKTGSSEKIQAARIAVAQEGAKLRSMGQAFMTDAFLTQNPQVVEFAQKLQQEVEDKAAQIDQVLTEKMRSGGALPTETKLDTTKKPVHTPDSLKAMFGK